MSFGLTDSKNALGVMLKASRSPSQAFAGSGRGVRINGSTTDDALISYGGGSSLYGGLGDDTYYVWDRQDVVVEAAVQGIDTVICYDWQYTLPANVENLAMPSAGSFGIGNALDNLIAGGDGTQLLDGAGGNDVLTGGPGADVFVYARGCGQDVITDFTPGVDQVRFNSTLSQFTSFNAVIAAMTQSGPDTVLNLGAGESIRFLGRNISDFTSNDFILPPNLGSLLRTFNDDFNSLAASPTGFNSARKPIWQTTYEFYGQPLRTLAPGNPEVEYYSDSTIGVNPFTNAAGILNITAAPAAPGSLPGGLVYTSGIITTQHSLDQLYGYFEMRAKLPAGQGFWPSFWLARTDSTWPPEIDVLEASSNDQNMLLVTAQSGSPGTASYGNYVPDMSAGYHTYGVSWRPDTIKFYFDGAEIMSTPTPADMHSPMYMIANLAVGGPSVWPGQADGVSSATMSIDYIRAYQYLDLPPTLPTATSMKYLVGDNSANILTGGSGDDRIEGGRGNDQLTGGAGADTFVVSDGAGTDTISDFQWGEDKLVIQGFSSSQVTTQALLQGLQVNFGTNHVILAGKWGVAPGDIVAGATTTTGTSAADTIDRSTIATPTASIYGLAGNDILKGGPGDDWIVGGPGNDILTGNGGQDSFVFSLGSGQDIITDFVAGLDRLVLQGATQGTLHASWATESGSTGIKLGYGTGGDTVFLPGVGSLLPDSMVLA